MLVAGVDSSTPVETPTNWAPTVSGLTFGLPSYASSCLAPLDVRRIGFV